MRKKSSVLSGLIVGLVFTIMGYAAYNYITKPMEEEAKASESWPSVLGEITTSEIARYTSSGETMYSANIHYVYKVENKEYGGSNITSSDGSTSVQSFVKKDLKKYPVGKQVKVYYDPLFPESSLLEPGVNFWIGLLFKIPLVFMVLGGLIFLSALKNLLRRILFGR